MSNSKLSTPNTSKRARVMAILQLCIAFTVIASAWGYPFLGELFAFKSKTLLYHTVMGDQTLISTSESVSSGDVQQRLERNHERFSRLPESDQTLIKNAYLQLQAHSETPFLLKIKRAFHIMIFELPTFEQAWLLLSIVISVLILLNVEGATQAAWLLPVLAMCYAINNQWTGLPRGSSVDDALFPTEAVIVQDYLQEPLSNDILTQREQLLLGWKRYLVREWAHQVPEADPKAFEGQAEGGEFAFNVARLKLLTLSNSVEAPFRQKESILMLAIYVLWNCFFAFQVQRKKCRKPHPN